MMITLESRAEHIEPQINIGEWHAIPVDNGSESQIVGVRYYEPKSITRPDELLLDGIAWSVNASTPRDVWRTGASAEATGMVTLGLEMPGMGPNSGPLTTEQLNGLRVGSWEEIGRAQWAAILAVLSARGIDITGKTLHFDGNSMSVSSNIGLIAAAPEGVKIGNIIAWEGTAWSPKSKIAKALNVGGLALRAPSMGSKIMKYQKLAGKVPTEIKDELKVEERPSPEKPKNVLKRIGRKLGAWLMPVVAMSRGEDARKLIEALSSKDTSETQIHIWNGEKSLVSRTLANERGAAILRTAGLRVHRRVDEDGRHLVEDNIPLSLEAKLQVLGTA